MDTLKETSDENNKVDIKITLFIFNQRYLLLGKLCNTISILTKHVDPLTNCYIKNNKQASICKQTLVTQGQQPLWVN